MKKIIPTLFCLFTFFMAAAQSNQPTEQATGLRADGKIYVVMAVVITILVGLVIYVISLDRKISRLEKKNP